MHAIDSRLTIPPFTIVSLPNRRTVLVQAAAALMLSATAGAQRVLPSLDAGGSALQHGDSLTSSAATLTPALRMEWNRATLGGSVSVSRFASGTSVQGAGGGAAFLPLVSRFVAEVAGNVAGTRSGGVGTSKGVALLRGHLMGEERGLWAGGGGGSASDGVTSRAIRLAEAGAWAYAGPAALVAIVSPTRVGALSYTDGEAAVRWLGRRAELGLAGGGRVGSLPEDSLSAGWASASAAFWITPAIAIVASGGAYPADVGTGTFAGRFASVALRFGPRPGRRSAGDFSAAARTRDGVPGADGQANRSGVLAFLSEQAGSGRQTLRVHAPAARTVEVTGDFTLWAPLGMTRADGGWWTVTVPLPAGVHEMNVRADGGQWLVPPGLPVVRDEFGGVAGVLTIP